MDLPLFVLLASNVGLFCPPLSPILPSHRLQFSFPFGTVMEPIVHMRV